MNNFILVILCSCMTFGATVLGSALVYFFKNINDNFEKTCLGLASGIMISASIFSLLIPALETPNYLVVILGILIGGGLIYLCKIINIKIKKNNKSLFFLAVTLHNIPEGMAVGLACALVNTNPHISIMSAVALSIGIAIQNIPEGTAIALPMLKKSGDRTKAFIYGILSGIVEPISALIMVFLNSYLSNLMPFFLSFAAGTMFYVVVDELIPESKKDNSDIGVLSFMIGFIIMMILDVSLG